MNDLIIRDLYIYDLTDAWDKLGKYCQAYNSASHRLRIGVYDGRILVCSGEPISRFTGYELQTAAKTDRLSSGD